MTDLTLIVLAIAKSFDGKVVYERNSVGGMLLVASLEKAGFSVAFHEHFLDHRLDFDAEAERLASLVEASSAVIGLGCHSVHLPFAAKAAERLRARFPGKKIVFGGIGPSAAAEDLLTAFAAIDAVVIGEGEATAVELMRRGGSGLDGVAGTAFRGPCGVRVNPHRAPIVDLDSIPLPAYDAVDFSAYEIPTVFTSRGCFFGCPFCSLSSFWGKAVRYRSLDNVIAELTLLRERFGSRYVFFGDPTFVTDRARVLELCGRLRSEAPGLGWEALVRIDRMDEELMSRMAGSGCEAVFYGLESGSDRVLRRIKRGFSVDQALSTIERSLGHFKTVEVSLMWGFPYEGFEDLEATLRVRDRLESMGCEVQLRWLEPYPGTELYRSHKDALFLPEAESMMFDAAKAGASIAGTKDFYPEGGPHGIKIAADVTNVRFIIAASHVVSMCRDLIAAHPLIFSDFHRFRTPRLPDKLRLARRYSVY